MKIKRVSHVLGKNKLTWLPSHLLFFDTESYLKEVSKTVTEHHFRLGTAIYLRLEKNTEVKEKRKYRFRTQDEFFTIVTSHLSQKKPLYVFACNIWYDLRNTNLLPKLVDAGFQILTFINKSRVVIVHAKGKQGSIIFLDTLNYLPFSVAQLGKKLGKGKLKADFERDSDQKLMKYCMRDTEIITEAMLEWMRFINKENLGLFSKSLASQALNAFRHRFMKHRIVIHNKKHIAELERKAYFGGRTECFYIGKVKEKPIYDLDVNSMYPYVMWKYEIPIRHSGYLENPSIEKLSKLIENYCVIAQVELETEKPYYPLRHKGKCIYPIGRFVTTLPTASLQRALKNNHIKKVFKLAGYLKANIFRDYVDYFYRLKKQALEQGKKIDYILSKLFLNSLYGKFGQRIDKVISAGAITKPRWKREEVYYRETGKHTVLNFLGNRFEELELNAEDGYNTFIAISAHVTDYARNVLLDYIETAGWENVYYVDTDSLFVNEKGYENLGPVLSETELGMLKLEKKINDLEIFGLKDYKADNTRKLKGIPVKAVKLKGNSYVVEIWPKPLSDLKEGIEKPYKTIKRVKVLKREYDKGIVTPTGRVLPLHFS